MNESNGTDVLLQVFQHGLRWPWNYVGTVAVCGLLTAVARTLINWVAPANIDMLFLLVVFLVAWLLGRGPALLAAFLSVGLFDFFFVPPLYTFEVADGQYLITFAVMLSVALITGQLAAGARERVHYLEMAQVAKTQAEAERLRNSVLASLSHDLRTPLTALLGLADTLDLAPLPPPHDETAQALRMRVKDLATLVDNLLDLARITSGTQPLRKEWQPLEEVVGTAIHHLESSLVGRSVEVMLAPDLPLLEFDAVLLERVLCNLLDNVVRHTPAGTAVHIEAQRAGDSVEIKVQDEGPGFPMSGPKAGLGLAICKAIIEAHGGRLALDEAPDGGALANIHLPAGTPPKLLEEHELA